MKNILISTFISMLLGIAAYYIAMIDITSSEYSKGFFVAFIFSTSYWFCFILLNFCKKCK